MLKALEGVMHRCEALETASDPNAQRDSVLSKAKAMTKRRVKNLSS
jgi:hypothetical protein